MDENSRPAGDRPEYVTCVADAARPRRALCGRDVALAFTFVDAGHARRAAAAGSRLTVCPACPAAVTDVDTEESTR
jgi:hypothetical protein